MNDTNRTTEKRKLTDLKPHPRHPVLFIPAPPHQVRELADSLRKNGQLTPIEVTPDGTIIAGHRRVAAATLLGWEDVEVRVRQDLADQGPDAVERRLIEDNLPAGRLSPVEVTRCLLALKKLGRHRDLTAQDRADLHVRIGERLGMKARTVDRLLRVVEWTPQEVQDAVAVRELALTRAERVPDLAPEAKEQIAREIRGGTRPGVAVGNHTPEPSYKHRKASTAVGAFLRGLERAVDDLEGRVNDVGIRLGGDETALLDRAESLIQQVREQARKTAERPTAIDELPADGEEDLPCEVAA